MQLYVPDLSSYLSLLLADGVNVDLRLSTSAGSDFTDVAHISIPIPQTTVTYELVGSSLRYVLVTVTVTVGMVVGWGWVRVNE